MRYLASVFMLTTIGASGVAAPDFVCADSDGASYRITLAAERRSLEITDKTGGRREIPLSDANVGRATPSPGRPLIYNRWNREGASIVNRLDPSVEVETQYLVQGGMSAVKLALIVDHEARPGLACKSTRTSVSVLVISEHPEARYAAQIREAARMRTHFGTLDAVGLLLVEESIQRMFRSPAYKDKGALSQFTEEIGGPLKNLDPRTVKLVSAEVPKGAAEWWNAMLGELRYAYYPELLRFASWINEGTATEGRDVDSLKAGFVGFAKSGSYNDKSLREFFAEQINASLKVLTEAELRNYTDELEPPAKAYVMQIWNKAAGRRSVTEAPQVDGLVRRLAAAIEAKPFNPSDVAAAVTDVQHAAASDPEATGAILQGAGPIAKRLSGRQREDVLGWLKSGEKGFFNELVK